MSGLIGHAWNWSKGEARGQASVFRGDSPERETDRGSICNPAHWRRLQKSSAFATVRMDSLLPLLRRDRLRLYVACPDEAHPRLWQAEDERSLEAAGVEP